MAQKRRGMNKIDILSKQLDLWGSNLTGALILSTGIFNEAATSTAEKKGERRKILFQSVYQISQKNEKKDNLMYFTRKDLKISSTSRSERA